MIEIIDRESQQMNRHLADLLDVSRISNDKFMIANRRFDISETIAEVVQNFRPTFENKKQTIHARINGPAYVFGDPNRLVQVLANLIDNAIKYTPAGGNIWVSCHNEPDRICVAVRDDGIGIDPHHQQCIYELFYQVEKSQHNSERGLGIGLYLVDQIIRHHRGGINVISEGDHRGCEFCFWLPLADAEAVQLERTQAQSPPDEGPMSVRPSASKTS
jgi:signal transduction histidine kinase